MKINIGLTETQRAGVAALLHALLADEHVLYTKTRKAHWNVSGQNFMEYHKFFEGQYEQLAKTIDEVAERSLKLGIKVPATMLEFSKLARLSETPGDDLDAHGFLAALLADHEALIRQLRENIEATQDTFEDAGTTDFFTGLMADHETMAWMLRRYLTR